MVAFGSMSYSCLVFYRDVVCCIHDRDGRPAPCPSAIQVTSPTKSKNLAFQKMREAANLPCYFTLVILLMSSTLTYLLSDVDPYSRSTPTTQLHESLKKKII